MKTPQEERRLPLLFELTNGWGSVIQGARTSAAQSQA
jgi:hypothetical protein